MSRILVIGGAGYIGSHCCKALARQGHLPIVLDNLSTGHRDFVRWGPLVEGDIRDKECLFKVFAEYKPVAVMHFAALALVGPSLKDPGAYYDVNVVGTLRLLEVMRDAKTDNLVFSSTCAVYGEPRQGDLTEDSECRPVNPYGSSKLACERMIDDFGLAHRFRSVRLRYFNAAGADPESEIGEQHYPETHLVPLIIAAALGRTPFVEIFGQDYPTPDGTAVRDYIHVVDLASAHLAALKHLLDGGGTESINLGTGKGFSVAQVIQEVENVSGLTVPRKYRPRRGGDPSRLVANGTKADRILGWQAIRGLSEIVRDALEWHRRHTT